MSTTIGSGFGILPTLIANSVNVHQRLDTLTEQVSSGMIAPTYAGLGSGAATALNISPQLDAMKTYQSNIGQATSSMGVTQTAMTQMQQIAQTFVAVIPNLNGLNPEGVDTVAAQARAALQQLTSLLNSQDATGYVFAGQDSRNPPVPSGASILSSDFYTQINAQVLTLSSGASGAAVAQATLDIGASNEVGTSPFSTYLSQPTLGQPASTISARMVQIGEGSTVKTGLIAGQNWVSAPAGGTSTTGSYMRDLMRSLATLGSLSSAQISTPGFAGLVQDTGASLRGVVSTMAVDVGVFGTTQASLSKTQTQLGETATALTGQLSSVQEVDMAATLSMLTSMQTQLQVSYRLISGANNLSLANFLPNS